MRIGVYDQNNPSGLPVVLLWGRENGHEFIHYDRLPESRETDLPAQFLINPTYSESLGYWENIQRCVQSNPQTHFGMVIPSLIRKEMQTARTALTGLQNVAYFGYGDIERLFDFLQNTKNH